MKYALISEEQLKAIDSAFDVSTTHFNKDRQTVLKAREIIDSLKPQEPVGYKYKASIVMSWHETKLFNIPLYALEQL